MSILNKFAVLVVCFFIGVFISWWQWEGSFYLKKFIRGRKRRKLIKWYLEQEVTVNRKRLELWSSNDGFRVLFDDLPYSFGARGGMSVTDVYMKGWNDLLYVLAFRKENDEGDSYVYPVLVFLGRDDKPLYEVVHSKEAFIRLAGQKNWDYFVKNTRINWNLYKIA